MIADLVLIAAVALTTLGMAVVVLAVVSPGLFYAGVYLIDAGLLALAGAGIWRLFLPAERA